MKRFQRINAGRPRENTKDVRGTVSLQIFLRHRGGNRMLKGNITRLISVRPARVSEVARAVEQLLFGKTQ